MPQLLGKNVSSKILCTALTSMSFIEPLRTLHSPHATTQMISFSINQKVHQYSLKLKPAQAKAEMALIYHL